MAYNTMSIVGQRPYVINNNMGFVKKREDEEETSSSSSSAKPQQQEQENEYSINPNRNRSRNVYEELAQSKEAHARAVASRDANLKNATINIAQILKDFRNTIKAIGTPPELAEEVNVYLELVEKQVIKENPDGKIVRSNLKNASSLLDNYITETLQRPSKVVENWIDALFLQQINYRFNEEEINNHFLVKFPNRNKENEEENQSENEQEEPNEENQEETTEKLIVVPTDKKLKSLFIRAKKYAYANDSKKAMELFKQALDRAIEIEDKETESKVLFEIGKIYDKNDYLAQALTSYNKSICATKDLSVKTKAHYSMAQIYDDVAQFESAINHYITSISYAGETENLNAQSTSLTKIGNIYADKYKEEAFEFLSVAEDIAKETKNSKTKGYVTSNIANAYNKFNKPQKALKYYSEAVKEFENINSALKVAITYKRAAELMQDYKNTGKAKTLLKKALKNARKTDDVQLMKEIHETLSVI